MARRVWYYYDSEVGNFHFGLGHPMKPQQVRMAHSLIKSYGLDKKMACFRPDQPVTAAEMTKFHSDDYIDFLTRITIANQSCYVSELWRYSLGVEFPIFDGLFEYCQIYTSGSVSGARMINEGKADIVINWSGGMHHSKKSQCVGFAPVNDCVLAILELLRKHRKVMYVDLSAHHPSGVEEAFYANDRVLTVSFHRQPSSNSSVFPGTGYIDDHGVDAGVGYSLNVPLMDGAGDITYSRMFSPIVQAAVTSFQPNVIVVQAGASSLGGDRYGRFNLTVEGHADMLRELRDLNLPMLVLGGSGYTLRNVARCWAYETAVLVGVDVQPTIPFHEYRDHYHPEYSLFPLELPLVDKNSTVYLEDLRERVLAKLEFPKECKHSEGSKPVASELAVSEEEPDLNDDMDSPTSTETSPPMASATLDSKEPTSLESTEVLAETETLVDTDAHEHYKSEDVLQQNGDHLMNGVE